MSIKRLTALVPFLLLALITRAGGDQPILKVLDGSIGSLKVDSTIMVEDAKYFEANYTRLQRPYDVQNLVSLEIHEGLPVYLRSSFTATAKLRIYITRNATGPVDSIDRDFTITYDTASNYRAKSTYVFTGGYRVEVKVLQLSTSAGWNVWGALKVTNQLQSFPQYSFDCAAQVIEEVGHTALAPNTDLDELPVSWSPMIGADEYDLEWTYIDADALEEGLYGNPSNPDADRIFENNATRVTITGTSYHIPLFYDNTGKLFYRVRAVQVKNADVRIEAYWSTSKPGGLRIFSYNGHERNLNWQATTSFAEEGKLKTVLKYFDGGLRERQIVTKENSTNRTIVAETFYDYQGRPVIQVLPAPTLSSVIGYTRNLNMGLNGVVYDKSLYDTLTSADMYCSVQGIPMDTTSGASRYYSPANELRDSGMHKFIPNAKGFPFTETEFTQDNTGRIARQSGVGEQFRIGSGHETRYYYGTPDQRELDALFGTEVGDYTHYTKNMVRDANGQYSVTYVDMKGKTIATALAGTPPDSIKLDKLPSNNSSMRTDNLLTAQSAVIRDRTIESKKGLLVPMAGNHTFTYKLDPQSLQLEGASAATFCYDCLYDLQITITDDCNNQKLGGQPFDTLVRNFSLSQIDTTCGKDSGFTVTFTKWLQEGSYEVTKKLTLSQYGMDYYRDSVFSRNNLTKSLETFVQEQRAVVVGQLQCKPSCESCELNLGTWEQFWVKFKNNGGVGADTAAYLQQAQSAYRYALQECKELCDSLTEAGEIRKAMLMDLMPSSGQYADLDRESDLLSVFFNSQDGDAPDTVAKYTTIVDYRNEDGNLDLVYDEGAGKMVSPGKLSIELFAQKFKPSWAEALLPLHPEYGKLTRYELLTESHKWDRRFESVETYAEAKKRGYLNPLNIGTAPFNQFTGTAGFIEADPLYTSRGTTFQQSLRDSLTKFRKNNTQFVTMWSVASMAAMCEGASGTCFDTYGVVGNAFNPATMCEGELNMAWLSFRQMYLDIKRNVVNKWIKDSCQNCITPANLIASGHQPHFSDAWEALSNNNVDLPSDQAGADAWKLKNENALTEYYDANCRAYVTQWFNQLKTCAVYDSASIVNEIIPRLIAVCKNGADASHPYGSSTVKPGTSMMVDQSFENVISDFNAQHGIGVAPNCNAYVITAPKAYHMQAPTSNKPIMKKPDDCECARIAEVYAKYQPQAAHYASFSDYMQKYYKTSISDATLNTLLSLCQVTGGPADCKYPAAPLTLPPVFQCNTGDVCVDCQQFKDADALYHYTYPNNIPALEFAANDSVQVAKNLLYEQYMNYTLGFTKTSFDYLEFARSCGMYGEGSTKEELINLLTDFRAYFNVIKNKYVNNYRLGGRDWTVRYFPAPPPGYTERDGVARMVENGVLKILPRDGEGNISAYLEYNTQRSFCVENAFSWEVRLKTGAQQGLGQSQDGFIGLSTNHKSPAYNWEGQGFIAGFSPGWGYTYDHQYAPIIHEGVNDARIPLGFLDRWRTYKYVVTPEKYRLFYDDTLLVEIDHLANDQIPALDKLIVQINGENIVEVDWIKLYDKNGNVLYSEDFENDPYLSKPDTNGLCALPSCEEAFRQFYNNHFNGHPQRGATQFQYINEEYIKKTGRSAQVCGADTCFEGEGYIGRYLPTSYITNFRPNDIAATFDGGTALAGGTNWAYFPGAPEANVAFLMRMDNRGRMLWTKTYSDSISHFSTIKAASDGGFITAGGRGMHDPFFREVGAVVMKVDKRGTVQWAQTIDSATAVDVIQMADRDYAVLVRGGIDCKDGFGVYYYTEAGKYLSNVFIPSSICLGGVWPGPDSWDSVKVSALVEERDSLVVFGSKLSSNVGLGAGYSGFLFKVPKKPAFNGSGVITGAYVPKLYKTSVDTRFNGAHKNGTGYLVNATYRDAVDGADKPYILEMDSIGGVISARRPVLTDTLLANQQLIPIAGGGFAASWDDDQWVNYKKMMLVYRDGIVWQRKYTLQPWHTSAGLVQDLEGNYTMLVACYDVEFEPGTANIMWLVHTDSMGVVGCDTASSHINFTNVTVVRQADVASTYAQANHSKPATKVGIRNEPDWQVVCPEDRCEDETLRDLTLCGRVEPVLPPVAVDEITNCSDSTFFIASRAQEFYQAYRDSLIGKFDSNYRAKCLDAYKYESFTVHHRVSEYHYTLYYYDQAGNLAKTVPPAGVRANYDSLWLNSVSTARTARQVVVPAHILTTDYRYNTINQMVAQKTPDAGGSYFWYDRLGRLVLSQNSKQKGISTAGSRFFSYTRYDSLGRITEVGQIRDTSSKLINDALTRNESMLSTWFTNLVKYRGQVTETVYDAAYLGFGTVEARLIIQQQNLRNRVSYMTYTDSPGVAAGFNQGSFYSYDIHGNVDSLLQDYGQANATPNMMNKNGNRWKKLVYEYDLISGKVNAVHYQKGWADQWSHRFLYDASNRLIAAETSTDGVNWEKEVSYDYYLHGPLARTTVGAQQVQGLDYAYTLQGWLKGVNSVGLKGSLDMGNDGLTGSLRQFVGRDVFGFGLNYFGGDYFPISATVSPFPGYLAFLPDSAYRPLYNGNISSMAESLDSVHIPGLSFGSTLLYNYKYDQLNRIRQLDTYKGFNATTNSWSAVKQLDQYKERVAYDANGNILQYRRTGNLVGTNALMDDLTYSYYPQTNQLKRVADNASAGTYSMDIDHQQAAENYRYDSIGNMIKDSAEGIQSIKWTVYGKIQEIIRNPSIGNKVSRIAYTYDAQGNRISKTVERQGTTMKEYTWYVRDARGNTVAVYYDSSSATDLANLTPVITERTINGSSRLGVFTVRQMVDNGPAAITQSDSSYTYRGFKQYELANHLGNVLATVADTRRGIIAGAEDTLVSYYYADVRSAQSYYPFGMIMPGRSATTTDCREELQDNVVELVTSDLGTGASQNGVDVQHNGIRYAGLSSATVTLSNQAVLVTNGGGASDGIAAYLPAEDVEANTTYVIEFDITDKSSNIFYFNAQAHTPTNDVYRVMSQKVGAGHHSIMFTSPEVLPGYIRLRISSNQVGAGTYFVVDNLRIRKFKVVDEQPEFSTDFNNSVLTNGIVKGDGLEWKPINSTITSLGLTNSSDKRLTITCTNTDQAYLKTEIALPGGKNYLLRFNMGQNALDKRLAVRWFAKINGVWSQTEAQGVFVVGAGNMMLNFTHPSGADSARLEFARSNNGNSYDGYNTPYSIDNFSITRLDTMPVRPVMVCGGCREQEVSLVETKIESNLDSGVVAQAGNRYLHKGVTWQPQVNGIVSVVNGKFRVENSGTSSSDGMLVVVPSANIEPFTTYEMGIDILEQSSAITEFNIQALSQTNDSYRVSMVQSGLGRRSIIFTTGATVGNYVALRISARPTATAGLYFIVDNFTFKKHHGVNMVTNLSTDFNNATMSGVNVNDNGQIWTPGNNTITSLSVTGTTDKKIQVNCTNAADSRLMTDVPIEGGKRYLVKFSTTQAVNDKRLFLQFSVRTAGGPWTITDQRGLTYFNSGDYQFNFTVPAGADELKVEFARTNTNSAADGLDVPYTIDNFSLQRVDVVTTTKAMVCDSSNVEGRGIYRYGFNGKENDNEVKGLGNQLDFGARIYDNRIGRWLSVDAYSDKYPNLSPYVFGGNSVLQFKDATGNWLVDKNGNIIFTVGKVEYEVNGNLVYETRRYYFYTNDGQAVEAVRYNLVSTIDNVTWLDEGKTVVGEYINRGDKLTAFQNTGDPRISNCHGNSLDFRPGRFDFTVAGLDDNGDDNVSKIYKNTAEFTPVKAEDVKPGDIAIFETDEGQIQHSATVTKVKKNGQVRLRSKDDRKKVEKNQTIEGIKKGNPLYKKFAGYYRHNGNKKVSVPTEQGNAGEPGGEDIKKIIEEVKSEKQ